MNISRERADQVFTREEKRLLVTRMKALYHRSFSETKSHLLFHLIAFVAKEFKAFTRPDNVSQETDSFLELDQAYLGSLLSTNECESTISCSYEDYLRDGTGSVGPIDRDRSFTLYKFFHSRL